MKEDTAVSRRTMLTAATAAAALALPRYRVEAYKGCKVAVVGSLTGGAAAWGQQVVLGVRTAVEDLNKEGARIDEVIVEDDQCKPEIAVSVARRLTSVPGIELVVGHVCSTASAAAAREYAKSNGLIQISPASRFAATMDKETMARGRTFQLVARPEAEGERVGGWVATRYAGRRVGIVNADWQYQKTLASALRKAMNGLGLKEAMQREYPLQSLRDDSQVRELVNDIGKTDVVVLTGDSEEMASIVKVAALKLPSKPQFVVSAAVFTSAFGKMLGESGDGTLMISPSTTPRGLEVIKRIKQRSGQEVDGYCLNAYAAVEAWYQAVREAGPGQASKVADLLRRRKVDTVVGQVSFDESGDLVQRGYSVYRVERASASEIEKLR